MDVLVTGSHLEATGRRSTQDVKIIDAKYFHCDSPQSISIVTILCRISFYLLSLERCYGYGKCSTVA